MNTDKEETFIKEAAENHCRIQYPMGVGEPQYVINDFTAGAEWMKSKMKEYGQQEFERGKKEVNEWISVKQAPEFDGDYLCFIVRKNECGTFSKYQKVLSLTMNRWVAADNERVVAYKKLSGEPAPTVFILDLPAPPQQGKESEA